MSEQLGLHPESGLYHIDHMPLPEDAQLREIRQKQLQGEPLSISESMRAGRDDTFMQLEGFTAKPDHIYRTVDIKGLEAYQAAGAVVGQGELDEFVEGENNHGVDWYLGAAALKYGGVIIEAPADPEYVQPAVDFGAALAKDPMVRHMKTSGTHNPMPMKHVTVYQRDTDGRYAASK